MQMGKQMLSSQFTGHAPVRMAFTTPLCTPLVPFPAQAIRSRHTINLLSSKSSVGFGPTAWIKQPQKPPSKPNSTTRSTHLWLRLRCLGRHNAYGVPSLPHLSDALEISMNDEVKVSLPLINGILGYLGTRPYGEVFQLVNAIHGEVQPQIPMPEMAKTDEAAKPVADAA